MKRMIKILIAGVAFLGANNIYSYCPGGSCSAGRDYYSDSDYSSNGGNYYSEDQGGYYQQSPNSYPNQSRGSYYQANQDYYNQPGSRYPKPQGYNQEDQEDQQNFNQDNQDYYNQPGSRYPKPQGYQGDQQNFNRENQDYDNQPGTINQYPKPQGYSPQYDQGKFNNNLNSSPNNQDMQQGNTQQRNTQTPKTQSYNQGRYYNQQGYDPYANQHAYNQDDQYQRQNQYTQDNQSQAWGSQNSSRDTSDNSIAQRIRDVLKKDRTLSDDAQNVQVAVSSGKVTLTGNTASVEEKNKIESIANQTNGVKSVTNNLEVNK